MAADRAPLRQGRLDPADLPACESRDRIEAGAMTSEELVAACIRRAGSGDAALNAWAYMEASEVLEGARSVDRFRKSGRPLGALHGLPVAVSDLIDVRGMPTANGTSIDADRRPVRESWMAGRLKSAGAVIAGKAETSECGAGAPAATRNPRDESRSAGSAAAGCAAAVAAGMVPLAVAVDASASVIQSASWCGVIGFRPTFGTIPRTGTLPTAPSVASVGVVARTIPDAALLGDVLAGYDPDDSDSQPIPGPRLVDTALAKPPVTPHVAVLKAPAGATVDDDCAGGFAELVEALGDHADEIELPTIFAESGAACRQVVLAEMAANLRHYYERSGDALDPVTRDVIERGRRIAAADYLAARNWRDALHSGLGEIFDRYDAIVVPAAKGQAPKEAEFDDPGGINALWVLTGLPCVTLPLLEGADGLPVGVQMIGQRYFDGRLLRTARWLANHVAGSAEAGVQYPRRRVV